MTTATATPSATANSPAHFLIRRLHSLTGIMFGGYIIVHLLVNSSLLQGTSPDMYQTQVNKIHSLPWLTAIEWGAILLPILFHTVYGLYVITTGNSNTANYGYKKNWFYWLQRITAWVLILFIAFHVIAMWGGLNFLNPSLAFDPHQATQSTVNHMHVWSSLVGYVVYPIGILCATFHLANGFWIAGVTWGLTVSKGAQRRWGVVCAMLFVAITAAAFAALFATLKAKPMPIVNSEAAMTAPELPAH